MRTRSTPGNDGMPSRVFLRTLGNTSMSVAVAYCGIAVLTWLLQWWISEAVPGMGLVKSFLHLLLLPSLLLLTVFLLMRQWRPAFGVTPAVMAFLLSYGSFLLPRTEAAPTDTPNLQVTSFNLQAPDAQEAMALARIIDGIGADVVALQELSPEAAAQFAAALKSRYPFLPPLLRLDYIFYDEAFQGASAHVWPESGPSDHRPIVANLILASSGPASGAN